MAHKDRQATLQLADTRGHTRKRYVGGVAGGTVTDTDGGTTGGIVAAYPRTLALSGTQDAVNKAYTYDEAVVDGTEQLALNGQVLERDLDYTVDYLLRTVTFTAESEAPYSSDRLTFYGVY